MRDARAIAKQVDALLSEDYDYRATIVRVAAWNTLPERIVEQAHDLYGEPEMDR